MRILILAMLMLISPVVHAQSLPANPVTVNAMEMVSVPGGCFQMGNTFRDVYFMEIPVHEVCVGNFAIGKYDVTRGAFRAFVDETGYRTDAEKGDGCYIHDGVSWKKEPAASWRSPGFAQTDDHPVVCVSWNDAVAYSRWVSSKGGQEFRLPTEAEWEYAARSGGKRERYAGSDNVDAVAWYSGNSGNTTHPVGMKQANGLGLYDMSGNVWQWTADWYGEGYYRESPRSNPKGASKGSKRIFRGGSWFYDARGVRTTYRDFDNPGFRSSYLGFRLASPGQ